MNDIRMPLRYQISNWYQLPECKSNNSRDLHIHVTEFMQNSVLAGTRIQVDHDNFGTLFACVVNAQGTLLSSVNSNVESTSAILSELERYGFLVSYNPRGNLKGKQIQYLISLQGLHFDKIRILQTHENTSKGLKYTSHVVAFIIADHPQWLDSAYSASAAEFQRALQQGSAIDISAISATSKFDWSWLDYVASIDDILQDNVLTQGEG